MTFLVVDGITSVRTDDSPTGRMFSVIPQDSAAAKLSCSRPYTQEDERRWLAGDPSRDLDAWTGWAP